MKIRCIEELQDLIDKDFAWRKKELIDIKLLIHSTHNPTMCRVGIAMLSAHFEGFIKQVANYYIVFISSQNIKLSNLQTNFAAIHTKKMTGDLKQTEKVSVYKSFLNNFLIKYNEENFRVRYAYDKPIIKTYGNPSSDVIKEILNSIGLDFTPYETKKNFIDADLLSNRHRIVHGEPAVVEVEDFDETFQNIANIMQIFSDQIINAAINKQYLRNDTA